jgi:hypothetical protein
MIAVNRTANNYGGMQVVGGSTFVSNNHSAVAFPKTVTKMLLVIQIK